MEIWAVSDLIKNRQAEKAREFPRVPEERNPTDVYDRNSLLEKAPFPALVSPAGG